MVTSRLQMSSRCRVAGSPCTPMLATWPPGPGQAHRLLEGGGHADGFDGDVGAEPAGELPDDRLGVLAERC